jgi:hypothetical protein
MPCERHRFLCVPYFVIQSHPKAAITLSLQRMIAESSSAT